MHEHAIGQATAADQAEDPVADPPVQHPGADRGHLTTDLEAGDVGGRAGRRRVVSRPLRHVGPVDARVAGGHDDLVGAGRRVRALLQPHDLVAPGPGVDDGSHG